MTAPEPGTVLDADTLAAHCEALRKRGLRIVWTNGCFDLLHAGHVSSLREARSMGDVLIVGVNSDASVRSLKGPHRPINTEQDRARVVAALRAVDHVVIFNESSPVALLRRIKPDIFAKGGDYTLETLNPAEREAVQAYGGTIRFLHLVSGKSTTGTLAKMKDGVQ